jgi:EpsI family protein
MSGRNSILTSKYAFVLTLALLVQGVLYYTAYGLEKTPENRPLAEFATNFAGWHVAQESQIEKEVQDVLRADDTLVRVYAHPTEGAASLFVAYFKTQRKGQAPHSPKNCLPGAGWSPQQEGTIQVAVQGESEPITINRYLVSRGENATVVIYWYQTRTRVIASEYAARMWLVVDSIRTHRSDTALVKVMVPVENGNDERATKTGVEFVQAMFPVLQSYLPN